MLGSLVLTALLAPFVTSSPPCVATAPSDDPSPVELAAQELAAAVDLPTPAERRAAARRLAGLDGMDLDAWLAAARAFRPRYRAWRSGTQSVRVDLNVEGEVESTELHVVIPRTLDAAAPAPLIVALHGAGGQGRDMARTWAGTAESLGAIVLAPSEAGSNRGFTGEPRERRSVMAAIRWLRRHADVDENRIWLTGYSRGGILCWDLALRYPGVFAAAAPQAGGPRLDLACGRNNMRYLDNLTATPVRAMLGTEEVADLRWSVSMFVDRAHERGIARVELVMVQGAGHAFDPVSGRKWPDWFAAQVRDPWPASVVRRAARDDETGNAWLSIEGFGKSVEETFRPTIRRKRGEPALDPNGMRMKVIEAVESKTARAEARFVEPGRFELESSATRAVRLLLPRERLPEKGRVVVRHRKKDRKLAANESSRVLLEAFVERFDRSFLPVAELEIPTRDR